MKKIRMSLPALAFLFAVAASLATIASPNVDTIRVTDDTSSLCLAIGQCVTASTGSTCEETAGVQLVRESNCTTPVDDQGAYTEF